MMKKVNILLKQKSAELTPEQLANLLVSLNIVYDAPEDLPFIDDDKIGKADEEASK